MPSPIQSSQPCPKCGLPRENNPTGAICPRCALQDALALSDEGLEAVLTEKPGDRIGRYKLLEKIGEGGCGVVYMAEQTEDVRRRVALKIVKLGMDTRQVLARFEAELQALALMAHPNIAQVLDAGATETGRPYFVMELVRGTRITDYCNQNNLSTRARLDLFIQVCQAIQHAHQKGIIHRDIKPSNILVTTIDGLPVPKVIDFGISKATEQTLTGKTLFTAFHQFLGTPAYMSPEQAAMSGHDIDTRSDIYTLGVLLYELLTNHLPFETEELLYAGFDEMRRKVREDEPPKPSTRLGTLAVETLTTVARERQSEPPKLLHSVRGDLDWIVMRCLEKDRSRRYASASGLAHDVERHLNSEPVTARPPGKWYRFRKFTQRNRLTFALLTITALVLVLGVVGSTWQAVRATHAEHEQTRLRQVAEREGSKSREVAKFLTDMLAGIGPSVAKGRDTKLLREILDKTVERVRIDLKDQPEIEAELLEVISGVMLQLGEFQETAALRREILELKRKVFGAEHRKLAFRRKFLGNDNPDVASSLFNLAIALAGQGRLSEAEAINRDTLELRQKLLGPDHPEVAASLNNLAIVLIQEHKFAEAEGVQRTSLAIQRKTASTDKQELATGLSNLGRALRGLGHQYDAERSGREAIDALGELSHDELAAVGQIKLDLAKTLHSAGKQQEALVFFKEVVEFYRKQAGDGASEPLQRLAWILATCQADSIRDGKAAIQAAEKAVEQMSFKDPALLNTLAAAHAEAGQFDRAISIQQEAISILTSEEARQEFTTRLKLYQAGTPFRDVD